MKQEPKTAEPVLTPLTLSIIRKQVEFAPPPNGGFWNDFSLPAPTKEQIDDILNR